MYDHVFPPCFEEILPCHPQTPCPAPFTLNLTLYLVLPPVGLSLVFPSLFFHTTPLYRRSLFIFIMFIYPTSLSPFRYLLLSNWFLSRAGLRHSFILSFIFVLGAWCL